MRFLILTFFLWSAASLLAESGQSTHIVVVHPPMFRSALEPWIQYRSAQGYTIHLLETRPETGEKEILQAIREQATENPLRAVLLVGDAYSPNPKMETLPSPRVPARVIGEFGEEQEIASDSLYGDWDGDGLPEITVGRFSVQSVNELDAIIRKTIRYENQNPGAWLRRINLVGGVGGFSPILDSSIESAARYILSRMIPPEYEITLTQADIQSPYCPAPNHFRNHTIARLNEGPLFWVYMGHGNRRTLDSVLWPGQPNRTFPIFEEGDVQYVSCDKGLPIAIFLACYTGMLDAAGDCLAEELHRRENGPVAVFAASRTAMPYGMSMLGIELIEEVFRPRPAGEPLLLGDVIHTAKRKSIEPPKVQNIGQERPVREMVESLAKVLDPTRDRLEEQRRDHIHLFHLFGDPLLRLPMPLEAKLEAPETARPNTAVTVRCILPDSEKTATGKRRAIVEIALPKSRNTASTPKNRVFSLTEESVREFNTLYAQANRRVISQVLVEVSQQEFSVEIPIPNL